MKKISLNPEVNMTLKEFKNIFKDHFKHIVPKDQPGAMKAEYDRIMKERAAAIAEKIISDALNKLDHDAEEAPEEADTNESASESSDSKECEQGGGK